MTGQNASGKKWRRWSAGLAALLLIVITLLLGYFRAPQQVLLYTKPITLTPGVHMLGNLDPATAYVVETSEGLVLIDTGLDQDARGVKAELGQLGLDWTKIRAILLTHVHADHTGGAQHLRQRAGAKIHAGAADARLLQEGRSRDAFCTTFYMPDFKPAPITVDVELQGDTEFTIGEARFQALAAPGHSPGSVCYLMERKGLRILFAGDVVMSLERNSKNVVRLGDRLDHPLGTYTAHLPPHYGGDAKAFLASLRKLRQLPVPDLLLPGHPRLDDEPQNARISAERWAALLDGGIQEMEQLLARHERDGANFLDGTPRRLLPDLCYFGEHREAALYGLLSAKKLVLVGAARGPGLAEFLEQRQRQLRLEPVAPAAILLTACGPDEIAGLHDLIAKTKAQVFASSDGLDKVRDACPRGAEVLAVDDLPKQDWIGVEALPLRGRGLGPVAYRAVRSGKTVLFSGRLPTQHYPLAFEALRWEISQGIAGRADCLVSIDTLAKENPDLWLPAVPLYGQNANLYDTDWDNIIRYNRYRLD